MAIRRYYLSEAGFNEGTGEVATPKPIVYMIFAEKYNWTPQQVNNIPAEAMSQMMLVLNMRLNVDQEITARKEHEVVNENKPGKKVPVLGQGYVKTSQPV